MYLCIETNPSKAGEAMTDQMFPVLILYEGKRWYIVWPKKRAKAEVKIEENGAWRDATTRDGQFIDVLNEGKVLGHDKMAFSEC